jgi:hypothetical protein
MGQVLLAAGLLGAVALGSQGLTAGVPDPAPVDPTAPTTTTRPILGAILQPMAEATGDAVGTAVGGAVSETMDNMSILDIGKIAAVGAGTVVVQFVTQHLP